MSTIQWTGNAHSVKQISTITIANTWAAADTCTITINGKDLVITCGSTTTTTALVATAIKEAWMAAGRLDGTSSSSNATSNFGGQDFGEFREMTATVSSSVVTLVAVTAGKPITLSVAENTAGSGTATLATPQAATGKWHWNNIDNWSGGAVPVNDDVCVFKESDIPCRYGLPDGTLEVTIEVWRSYTGEVGLPAINRDEASYPYPEYRQRYVRLDDAGTGTNIAHRFGLGQDGMGCRLFNLKHSTIVCSPVVYFTGTPLAERVGAKALNICCTADTSTLNILSGSVEWSSQDSGTSAFATVTQTGGDSRGADGLKTSGVLVMSGGTCTAGGTLSCTYTCRGGTLHVEKQTATVTTMSIHPGASVDFASGSTAGITITTLNMWGGVFDASNNAGTVIITNSTIYAPSRFLDPYKRVTLTNDMSIYFDVSPDLRFGQSPLQPLKIGF